MVTVDRALRETVISTRIRFARNLACFPFPSTMKDVHAAEVLHLVSGAFEEMSGARYQCFAIDRLSENEKTAYQEGHLVSPLLLKNEKNRAVILSTDKKIAVMGVRISRQAERRALRTVFSLKTVTTAMIRKSPT